MNCAQVEHWLLESDDPRPESVPAEIALHLQICPACGRLARDLVELEARWRSLPLPPESAAGQAALLAGLPQHRRRVLARRQFLRWSAAAAAGLAAAATGAWVLLGSSQAEASEELFDHLVDWNLELTHSDSVAARARLYDQGALRFQAALQQIAMPAEHLAVARGLLENGAWLAGHRDALDEAERFDGLAERLLTLACAASEKKHFRRMDSLLDQYCRVLEAGVNPNIDLAETSGSLDFQRQRRLERLVLEDPVHVRDLNALLERAPHASRSRIGKAMHLARKRAKRPRVDHAARGTVRFAPPSDVASPFVASQESSRC